MMPILLELHLFGVDLSLPTYGALLALGFLLALWAALRQARRAGVEKNTITDLWIICLLSGVIGAKLLLYLLDIRYYIEHPGAILHTIRSAGVWYGGLLLAILACVISVRRRGLDVWLIGDVLAPAIALGQAVGRLGCFAAGCCYGQPSTLPWAVTFTSTRANDLTGVPLDIPLHPTQLYHLVGNLALFVFLLVVAGRKRFIGQVLLLYLIAYSVIRGGIEFFRGDPRGALLGFSTSQVISAGVLVVALFLYFHRGSRRAANGETDHRKAAPAG